MSQRLALKKRRQFALADGRIIDLLMGAEGEDDPNEDENAEGDSDEDGDDENDSGKGDSGSVTRDEFEQLKRRMQAADKAKSAAEAKVKEYELAGASELEKANAKIEELTTQNEELKTSLQEERIGNAFLSSNTVTWHDPALARKEIDLEAIVGDDGAVDNAAMKKAIEKLSKEKPFLVKATEDGNPNGNGGNKNGRTGSTGNGTGQQFNGQQKTKQELDREALEKKYPALRR